MEFELSRTAIRDCLATYEDRAVGKAGISALLLEYGCDTLSELPENVHPEFRKRLKKLHSDVVFPKRSEADIESDLTFAQTRRKWSEERRERTHQYAERAHLDRTILSLEALERDLCHELALKQASKEKPSA